MNRNPLAVRRARTARAALFAALIGAAVPVIGQDYGDTPYVQTPQNVVDKIRDRQRLAQEETERINARLAGMQ